MIRRNGSAEERMRKDQIIVARNEEAVLMKRDGTVDRSVLPGRSVSLIGETPYLYRILKESQLCGPVGYGQMTDACGGVWSCCAQYTCRLLSARRFAVRNGERILEGIGDEKILRDLIRDVMKGCLAANILKQNLCQRQDDGSSGDFWQIVTDKIRDRLFENGWELVSLEPEDLRRGTHEDTCHR